HVAAAVAIGLVDVIEAYFRHWQLPPVTGGARDVARTLAAGAVACSPAACPPVDPAMGGASTAGAEGLICTSILPESSPLRHPARRGGQARLAGAQVSSGPDRP